MASVNLDCTASSGASSTFPSDGVFASGTTTVLDGDHAATATTVDAPTVVNGNLIVDSSVQSPGGATIATGGGTIQVGKLTVTTASDGTAGETTISVLTDNTGSGSFTADSTDLGPNRVVIIGNTDGSAHLGTVTGTDGSGVVVSGPTTTGSVPTGVPVLLDGRGDFPAEVHVKDGTLTVGSSITGGDGSSVNVHAGGTLDVTGATQIASTLNVNKDGTTHTTTVGVTGDTTISGTVTITPPSHNYVPHFENLVHCDGSITFNLKDFDCSNPARASGLLFTSANINHEFACQVTVTGKNGCTVTLKNTWASPSRRLLGTDADCNTASLTNTDATYNVCGSGKNSASRATLSYISIFVALFVTLFFL
jgi:hypothetical protein